MGFVPPDLPVGIGLVPPELAVGIGLVPPELSVGIGLVPPENASVSKSHTATELAEAGVAINKAIIAEAMMLLRFFIVIDLIMFIIVFQYSFVFMNESNIMREEILTCLW